LRPPSKSAFGPPLMSDPTDATFCSAPRCLLAG
jgi:hypothetical protein